MKKRLIFRGSRKTWEDARRAYLLNSSDVANIELSFFPVFLNMLRK